MIARNRIVAALAVGSVTLSTFPAAPVSAQRVEIGNASTVVGEVTMTNAQITRPRRVERRQRIAWGDLVATGRRSQLQILLLDRSTFGVGARSRIRIDRFVYDPDRGRSVAATVLAGAVRFLSGRRGANDADIQTPAGRIGIRGTAIDMIVGEEAERIGRREDFVGNVRGDDDEATLVVLRGPGAATAGDLTPGRAEVESAGVTVLLDRPGLAAYIPRAGAPPIGPFPISNRGLARVQEELAPSVAHAGNGGLLGALIPLVLGAVVLGTILGDDDNNNVDNTGQDQRQTPIDDGTDQTYDPIP